jgi:AAHS family 4-hydroxybenzoate transporter-like MFS transporter
LGETVVSATVIDLPALIDEQPISRFQIQVLILCFAVLFVDGYDALAIGNVGPPLAQALHIGRSALGPVFSIGFLGAMLGTVLFGTLADRLGRRRMIIASAALFGVCTLLTVKVTSVGSLMILRFITGLGLGGAYPNTIALMTELAPRRARTTLVTFMQTGIPAGAALSGIIVAWLVEAYGWRTVFFLGGVGPLFLSLLLVARLPESVRFLALKGRSAGVMAILSRINPRLRFPPRPSFVLNEEDRLGMSVLHLLSAGRALGTALLWTACLSNLLALQFLGSWLPTLINTSGIPIRAAVWPNVFYQVGGIVGAVLLGKLADARGTYRILPSTLVTGAVFVSLAGLIGSSLALLLAFSIGMGFCIAGGQVVLNALAGAYYPTYIRSTGAGWALGFGRFGAVLSGVLGTLLLGWHWPLSLIFFTDGFFALCAAGAVFLMGVITPENDPRRL